MDVSLLKYDGIVVVAGLCLLIGSAVSAQTGQEHLRVIDVKTVKELYAAVNNSLNRGVTVRLVPGTYVLGVDPLRNRQGV